MFILYTANKISEYQFKNRYVIILLFFNDWTERPAYESRLFVVVGKQFRTENA